MKQTNLKLVSLHVMKKVTLFNLHFHMEKGKKTITIILEIVKAIAGMLIGYFGGNAIM